MRKNPIKRLSIIFVCLTIIAFLIYGIFAFCMMQPNVFIWSTGDRAGFTFLTVCGWILFITINIMEDILDDIYKYFGC